MEPSLSIVGTVLCRTSVVFLQSKYNSDTMILKSNQNYYKAIINICLEKVGAIISLQ